MTNDVRTAAHRLESGLVRLARRGTSALSKRRGKLLVGPMKNEKWKIMENDKWKIPGIFSRHSSQWLAVLVGSDSSTLFAG
jgi:hypothetical protein